MSGVDFAQLGTSLHRANGTTVVADTDAITSLGVASGIAGQGSLATLNALANGSAFLTGFGAMSGVDFAQLGTSLYRANGTTVVADTDAITSLGVASGIAGQGSLATLNALANGSAFLTGFGAMSGVDFAQLGTSLSGQWHDGGRRYRRDHLAGVASGIAGQGSLATRNTAAYGSEYLTGFGALAPPRLYPLWDQYPARRRGLHRRRYRRHHLAWRRQRDSGAGRSCHPQ